MGPTRPLAASEPPLRTGNRHCGGTGTMSGPYGIVGLVVAVILILLLLRLLGVI